MDFYLYNLFYEGGAILEQFFQFMGFNQYENMTLFHIKLTTYSIQEEVAPSNFFAFYGKFKLTSKKEKCSIKVPRKYPLFIVTISEHSPKFGIK
jgi:hypothetical protein